MNTRKKLLIASLMIIMIRGICFSNSYYFSSVNGNDSYSGLSPSTPWKSMSKLGSLINSLKAGDIVYFEKGSEWEQVKIKINNLSGSKDYPILFTVYGSGKLPVFKGSKVISSLTKSGNLWKKVDTDFPDFTTERRIVPFIYINNRKYETSRMPNTGYYNTYSAGVSDRLTDQTQNWTNNYWKNGLAVIRETRWNWVSPRITGNNQNTLNFESIGRSFEKIPALYMIRNHPGACDIDGEWAQQNDTVWIYDSQNLNSKLVEVPVIDTMFYMINSQYIKFKDLNFERAVMVNFYSNNSIIEVQNCSISDAGLANIIASNTDINIHDSYFTGSRRGGIYMETCKGNITNNLFKNTAFYGADNGNKANGSCIFNWYCKDKVTIDNNRFDSINIAYSGHWSNAECFITRNYITNFGMTINDCGALYFGGDFTTFKKYVKRNTMINANNTSVHGIYMDYLTQFVEADSNTIANTNTAIYFHVAANNKIRNNNIVNPAKDMQEYWNQAIRFDEYSYHYGGEGTTVKNNELTNNNIVLGKNFRETAVLFHSVADIGSNTIDYNKYFDPFTSDNDIFVTSENYGNFSYKPLSNWQNSYGKDKQSTYNSTNWTYSSVSGINQDDFVLLLINPTDKDSVIDLNNYGASYMDIDGKILTGNVTVKQYYSKILFYYKKVSTTNRNPVINNQGFVFNPEQGDINKIGTIIASDPDNLQTLNLAISAGNENSIFNLNSSSGELYINSGKIESLVPNTIFYLTVNVNDNGQPSLSSSATISVKIEQGNESPVVEDQRFVVTEEKLTSDTVGVVFAYDPNPSQKLEFAIVSGNTNNIFDIGQNCGTLLLKVNEIELVENEIYQLTIRVSDDGTIKKSSEATVVVEFQNNNAIYIDPENSNDVDENGSFNHPYNSWNDVVWEEGNNYYQKSGTEANIEKINILVNSVTISSYGTGAKPIIRSNSKDFAIRAYEKKNLIISNIEIIADEAISCIYLLGGTCDNNLIENCVLQGADYGIRAVDGINIKVKYNVFKNKADGIYSLVENTEVYYNIFKNNETGINISSQLSYAKIFNNVFYGNKRGISASFAELIIYNNIFYLDNSDDIAISHTLDKVISDYNIFYPERIGFIEIDGKKFNSLQQFQSDNLLDMNSFSSDPLFMDIYNDNFTVMTNSPAIDNGRSVGIQRDFAGILVPSGGATDIGLFETPSDLLSIPKKINSKDNSVDVMVYPNPASEYFKLSSNNKDFNKASLSVKDILGRTKMNYEFSKNDDLERSFDISDLKAGTYFILLYIDNILHTNELIVK